MAEPDARGLEPLRGPDGVALPGSFAPLAGRLAAGRITVTSIVTGEVGRSDAYRFLMADDNLAYAQVGEWEAHIEDLVAGRRRELLGDRWLAYEQHLAGLMSSGAIGSTDAQIAAFHHAMATGANTTASAAPTDRAAQPEVLGERASDPADDGPSTERPPGDDILAASAIGGITQVEVGPGLAGDGEGVPAQLTPIVERLVAGRITVTEAEAGELGPAETLRFLLGDDAPSEAQLEVWAASLGQWVAQRRQELLSDRFAAYEQHLTALLAEGTAEADAPGRAYREVMAAAEAQTASTATDAGVVYQHSVFFADHDRALACADALRAAGCAVQLDGDTDSGWDLTAVRRESLAHNDSVRQIAQIVESFGGDYSQFGIDNDLGRRWPGDTAEERYGRYEAGNERHPGLDNEQPARAVEEEARAAAMAYAEARLGHLASETEWDEHQQLLDGEAERIYQQQQTGRPVPEAAAIDHAGLDPHGITDDLMRDGIPYDRAEWTEDGEGGVRRHTPAEAALYQARLEHHGDETHPAVVDAVEAVDVERDAQQLQLAAQEQRQAELQAEDAAQARWEAEHANDDPYAYEIEQAERILAEARDANNGYMTFEEAQGHGWTREDYDWAKREWDRAADAELHDAGDRERDRYLEQQERLSDAEAGAAGQPQPARPPVTHQDLVTGTADDQEPEPADDLLAELSRTAASATPVPLVDAPPASALATASTVPVATASPVAGPRFRPAGQQDLAPSTPTQRARANIAALKLLTALRETGDSVTAEQQQVLARWGGWGSVPQIFDDDNSQWAGMRTELRELLNDGEYRAAARTTINAHYTDAAFVAQIWDAMRQLGFTGGQVIEPGSGAGVFLGLAPDGAHMTGVELDPTTAAISRLLYPHARILTESFAATRAPAASFDAAIGNVPFGNVILHDPRHNAHRLTIHNHFLVKALDLVKPGGLMAMVTSAYTMDAANPATRRLLADQADLIGAIRLPSRAHRAAAGTDALTDILLLRRREPGREPDSVDWELTNRIEINEHALRINEYFVNHPEQVLGELITGDGLYRDGELGVRGPVGADLITPLRDALAAVVAGARERELTFAPQSGAIGAEPVMLVGQGDGRAEGHIQVTVAGGFDVVHSGIVVAHEVPASQAAELRALLELRDITMALLGAEAATLEDTDEIGALRERLNRRYDAYHSRYQAINRFSMRNTGRTDPQTGEPKTARIRPPQGRFREDTYAAAVFALEHFDAETQTARKVELFTQRVISARPVRQGADNPADALAIVMDVHGRVDLEHVAGLLGVDAGEARTMLGDLVYPDPDGEGQLTPAAAYLSGNVRVKLAQAELAVETDPQYEPNVAALRNIIPEDIQPVDIHAALGAVWINAAFVQQFLQEILEDRSVRVTHPGGSIWVVDDGDRGGVQSREVWGTSRMPAVKIAAAMLEQRPINVYDIIETPDGEKRFLNGEATAAAREKGRELNERFGEWIWEDPARADTLVRAYNTAFNGLVLRNYDNPVLSLPGLAASFTLRPHQLAAIARIIAEPAVLLGHEVGAGKTLEIIAGSMELRRLGLARKPATIIPNHMSDQFAREWLQAYPQAKILMVTRDDLSSPERRRHFVARCATGDWDAVIMSRSAFERIPVSIAEQERYMRQELEAVEAQLRRLKDAEKAAGGDDRRPSNAVKRMEKIKLQTEERLRKKLDSTKDDGITFEQTGIDYCFVDEAHGYKNLRTPSNIAGAGIDGSQRASDLDMKLSYLRERYGGRIATFATATPIANSVTESYVMQKYLRPDLLLAAGIEDFDGWAATFGEVVTTIELSPDGSGFRTNSRFAKFRNVPELLKMFWVMADIKTAEDLNLPTPALAARADGQRLPETVPVPPSAELLDYIPVLGDRAEDVRNRVVEPEVDNMLKISGDGRKAALDMRMVDPGAVIAEPQKLDIAAGRIHRIWAQHRDTEYPAPDGSIHPRKGAFQIVFLDLGTPGGKGFGAYDELRTLLAERGMPRESVRFVHEATTDKAKGDLFAACRDGRISVLVGSSEKMGVGTNIQTRAVALHHLDCPWKPAEVQQREGRIIRQGNLNPEVQILRYVTERSFDGYMWQTVARKQRFIAQVMRGKLDVREIDDIGEAALSYSEVMAIAAGNPLLAAKARAESEVQRLSRLERAHLAGETSLDRRIVEADRGIARANEMLQLLSAAMGVRRDTKGDQFSMHVGDRYFDQRAEAGRVLQAAITALPLSQRPVELGRIGGFTFTGFVWNLHNGPAVTLELQGIPDVAASTDTMSRQIIAASVHMALHEIQSTGAAGFIQRLENKLTALERDDERMRAKIERHEREATQARAKLGAPFKHAEALQAAKAELDDILAELESQAEPPKPAVPVSGEEALARVSEAIEAAVATNGNSTASPAGRPAPVPSGSPQVAEAAEPAAPLAASAPVLLYALQHLHSATATDQAKLTAYLRLSPRDEQLTEDDRQLLREDLERIAAQGTVREQSTAQALLEVAGGTAPEPGSPLAAAIAAAGVTGIGDPAQRVQRYQALTSVSFDELHERHRTAVLADLEEISSSGPRGRGRRVRGGAFVLSRNPAHVTEARRLIRALVDTQSTAGAEPGQIRLVIDRGTSTVHGTRREDIDVRAVLKDANFRWLPGQQVWGMNSTVLPETRQRNTTAFIAGMARAGLPLIVDDRRAGAAANTTAAAETTQAGLGNGGGAAPNSGSADLDAIARRLDAASAETQQRVDQINTQVQAVTTLQHALLARAEMPASAHPMLPGPDLLRALAGDPQALLPGGDGTLFANRTSSGAWEIREATTGLLITDAGQALASSAEAQQAMGLLAKADMDFTAAASQLAQQLDAHASQMLTGWIGEVVAAALPGRDRPEAADPAAIAQGLLDRAELLQREQSAGSPPLKNLPNPADLAALAGRPLTASTDGRFFGVPEESGQRWFIHEATTGMRLTRLGQVLPHQGAAERAMRVLAGSPLDFAAAAEAVGRPPHRVDDVDFRRDLNDVLVAAHAPPDPGADDVSRRVAAAHPLTVSEGLAGARNGDADRPVPLVREPAEQLDIHR